MLPLLKSNKLTKSCRLIGILISIRKIELKLKKNLTKLLKLMMFSQIEIAVFNTTSFFKSNILLRMLIKLLRNFFRKMAMMTKVKRASLTLIIRKNRGLIMMFLKFLEMPQWMKSKRHIGN